MPQKISLNFLKTNLNNKQSDRVVIVFILIILLLFVYNDITTGSYFTETSLWLKMVGLGICVVYSGIKCWSNCSWDSKILCIALLITALGDYMLTINRYFVSGIICFSVVHLLYIVRQCRYLSLKQKRFVLFFGIAMVGVAMGLIRVVQPILYKIAVSYGVILCLSLLTASMLLCISDKNKKHVTIFFGVLLFFLCDTCVAIFNITNGKIQRIAGLFIWIWYLPAQLCLVLSGDKYQHNKGEK